MPKRKRSSVAYSRKGKKKGIPLTQPTIGTTSIDIPVAIDEVESGNEEIKQRFVHPDAQFALTAFCKDRKMKFDALKVMRAPDAP